jgi:hypothetical protein
MATANGPHHRAIASRCRRPCSRLRGAVGEALETADRHRYDPTRDVVPISSVVDGSIFIAVSESLKISSLAELVAFARAQPGKLNYCRPMAVLLVFYRLDS